MRVVFNRLTLVFFLGTASACAPLPPPPAAAQRDAFAQAAESTIVGKATGVVLVARHGKILWERSVGGGGSCAPIPLTGAAFDALSIGKTFTAVAVQRLAEEGRIDLSAPLRRYIPELPPTSEDATVQNALDNASGWSAYLNDEGDFDPEDEHELVRDLGKADRPGPVGQYRYSNTGFQVLGLIVERASGKPFKDAMRQLVFSPAGLKDTNFLGEASWRSRQVAIGCLAGKQSGSVRVWPSTWNLLGAAGIGTTVRDLYRFNRYIVDRNGLGTNGRRRMLADGSSTGGRAPYKESGRTGINYGSGFYHWRDSAGRRVHFHGGDGNYGFHDAMFWREDDDLFIVGLFNSGDPSAGFDRAAFIDAFAAAAQASGR